MHEGFVVDEHHKGGLANIGLGGIVDFEPFAVFGGGLVDSNQLEDHIFDGSGSDSTTGVGIGNL